MRALAFATGLFVAGWLAACSDRPAAPDSAPITAETGKTATAETPLPQSAIPPTPAPTAQPNSSEERSTAELALPAGVYVLPDAGCANPPNAAWRVWNGQGLSGSSTRACRAAILARKSRTYTIANSCENTYDGSRTTETLDLTVTDHGHFSVKGMNYRLCSMAQLPDWLRDQIKP